MLKLVVSNFSVDAVSVTPAYRKLEQGADLVGSPIRLATLLAIPLADQSESGDKVRANIRKSRRVSIHEKTHSSLANSSALSSGPTDTMPTRLTPTLSLILLALPSDDSLMFGVIK